MSGIQEPFSEGNSLIHRLDPRGKVIIAGLFAAMVAVAKSMPAALAGLVLSLLCLALARLPLKKVIVRLLVVNSFIFFLFMVVSHENHFLEHTVKECCHVHTSSCELISMDLRRNWL